jgi:hypothetical protein
VFSAEDIEKAKRIVAELGKQLNLQSDGNRSYKNSRSGGKDPQKKDESPGNGNNETGGLTILPSELLVIAGIVCDVLQVQSVEVNRNQTIEIVLTGSLKRSTQLDKIMKQVGKLPFDQVMGSIINNSIDED